MAKRRRILRRKRFFVGCEGESEQGYAALLQVFANTNGLAVHLDAKVLSKAGDPLALVERAAAVIAQDEAGAKPPYVERFLLLDTDLFGQNRGRDARMFQMAQQTNLKLVRQDCCFEAFLLRHIDCRENDRPPSAPVALKRLIGVWPQYKKGTPAQELAERLTFEDVQKAAVNPLNADFAPFLGALGLIKRVRVNRRET